MSMFEDILNQVREVQNQDENGRPKVKYDSENSNYDEYARKHPKTKVEEIRTYKAPVDPFIAMLVSGYNKSLDENIQEAFRDIPKLAREALSKKKIPLTNENIDKASNYIGAGLHDYYVNKKKRIVSHPAYQPPQFQPQYSRDDLFQSPGNLPIRVQAPPPQTPQAQVLRAPVPVVVPVRAAPRQSGISGMGATPFTELASSVLQISPDRFQISDNQIKFADKYRNSNGIDYVTLSKELEKQRRSRILQAQLLRREAEQSKMFRPSTVLKQTRVEPKAFQAPWKQQAPKAPGLVAVVVPNKQLPRKSGISGLGEINMDEFYYSNLKSALRSMDFEPGNIDDVYGTSEPQVISPVKGVSAEIIRANSGQKAQIEEIGRDRSGSDFYSDTTVSYAPDETLYDSKIITRKNALFEENGFMDELNLNEWKQLDLETALNQGLSVGQEAAKKFEIQKNLPLVLGAGYLASSFIPTKYLLLAGAFLLYTQSQKTKGA